MSYKKEGKWWVSQANYNDKVMEKYDFADNIKILDTSLRDGEQQPGIILNKKNKVEIAKALDKTGIHRIEAGTPAVSKEDEEAIKEIVSLDLEADIYVFVRNMVEDMELAKKCGVDGVIAEIPGSEHLLEFGKQWSAEKAINAAIEATTAAHELGLDITFFPADSSRASFDFLLNSVKRIEEEGHMDSLAIVDTFGAYSPQGAAYTVSRLKEEFEQPIEVHFHDDFGLGVATTIAGLAAGAEVAHVTINGIGERAGSAPLEQVVLALKVLYGQDTGIKTENLKDLSELMVELSGYEIEPTRPVVGDRLFGWETGMPSSLWLNAKDEHPLAMLPYMWNMTGQDEPKIYLGKKSGKDNLEKWLNDNNVSVPQEKKKKLLNMVKEKSIELQRDLNVEEFKELVKEVKK